MVVIDQAGLAAAVVPDVLSGGRPGVTVSS